MGDGESYVIMENIRQGVAAEASIAGACESTHLDMG